jgi:F420-0:gamma-glutamyl ligase-like protein
VRDALRDVELQPGDVVAVSEKAVAICQGRSYPVGDVEARPLARTLSKFVGRTASGIGLGIPATMELAIREAGEARILGATAAAAVTKPFGVKGVFYRVAGPAVRAIDGPTRGTIPPYDGHAKLGPEDPEGVARELARELGVGVAIIDANDIGVNVLGVSPGVDAATVASLLRDNPLGQGAQQTPIALLRPVSTDATTAR